LEKGGSSSCSSSAAAGGGSSAAFVTAFDSFLNSHLNSAIAAGKALNNNELSTQLDSVEKAFRVFRNGLDVASKSKKPSDNGRALFKPVADLVVAVDAAKRGTLQNHQKAVTDGMGCLNWIFLDLPVPHIKESVGSFLFYGNKVLVEFKGKTEHVEFINKFKDMLNELGAYVKEYHTTGLVWNASGQDVPAGTNIATGGSAPAASKAPAPAAAGGPPGPPPPPSVAELVAASGGSSTQAAAAPAPVNTSGLFAAINAGNVTGGLKKVTDDMKTHKNPALRATSTVPAKESTPEPAAVAATTTKAGAAPVGPPRCELEGKVWWIENQVSKKDITITETNPKQSIFISKCTDCVVNVSGKVNQITIDKSSRTGVVFDSVVAAADIVNSKKIQLQCTGTLQSLSIDKVEEAQVYLNKNCLEALITTSLSSDVNIFIPGATDDADLVEQPIPYQFQTRIVKGKLVTETLRHE
jgi:adenylyl cyclase-associated protein